MAPGLAELGGFGGGLGGGMVTAWQLLLPLLLLSLLLPPPRGCWWHMRWWGSWRWLCAAAEASQQWRPRLLAPAAWQRDACLHPPPPAPHCPRRPVEINASDERTAGLLVRRVQDAVQMRPLLDVDQRPNCVIIDEVDGATGGAEGHGAIQVRRAP
jgi:hypothetical protein